MNVLAIRDNIIDDISYVYLLETMPMPALHNEPSTLDMAVVDAARTSYLGDRKGYEKDKALLKYLWKNGHHTPFEMVQLKFKVKAPILVFWQWIRHRAMSYNLSSGRYTEYDDEFYIPKAEGWRKQKSKQNSEEPERMEGTYELTMELTRTLAVGYQNYNAALDMGVAKEQARLFLPAWCLYHEGIISCDLRNLLHFIKLRTDEHAQWEIRQYAMAIERILMTYAPWTMEAYNEWNGY